MTPLTTLDAYPFTLRLKCQSESEQNAIASALRLIELF